MKHVVIDGSNIATEGRDAPSLAQLDEAVRAFIDEYAPDVVTVVVDATFPNRIDAKERQTFEDAVDANELITPPAGAIGRGDAFVLQIARKAEASILSNDSFQEFHGDYPWLFERGRLIGGRPGPQVGGGFMERTPRRSRATKAAAEATTASAAAPADGAGPEPVGAAEAASAAPVPNGYGRGDGRAPARPSTGVAPYNEALPFIEFIADHPVGSEVEATVERFSSHGAYVMSGAARGYVPLRNLGDPAPRGAGEVLRVGETRRFVVVAIDPPRRGIDLALPGVVEVPEGQAPPAPEQVVEALTAPEAPEPPETAELPAKKTSARRSTAKQAKAAAARPAAKRTAKDAAAKEAPASRGGR